MGSTIIAGTNTDNASASNHNRASITKDATGTDFNTFMGNQQNSSIALLKAAPMAQITPATAPKKKPAAICTREVNKLFQKDADGNSSTKSTRNTRSGEGRKISLFICLAATYHMMNHNSMDTGYRIIPNTFPFRF